MGLGWKVDLRLYKNIGQMAAGLDVSESLACE